MIKIYIHTHTYTGSNPLYTIITILEFIYKNNYVKVRSDCLSFEIETPYICLFNALYLP